MKRKLTAIALTLAAVIVLTAGGPNSTILLDNFNDGDAVGWDQNDLTGVGVFDASSGSYLIETAVPIAIDDPSVGTVESHYERSLELPRFANGTIRCTIRANTDGTTLGFLIRDNENTESDYGFYGSTSFGTFYIERFELDAHPEAPQTIIAMADPDESPFVAGETYNLEGRVVGKRLTLKAWRVGDPEPTAPTLSVTDKVLKPGRGNRISVLVFFDPVPLVEAGVGAVRVSGTFDDITFTPGANR
jgi:hypothetical protein